MSGVLHHRLGLLLALTIGLGSGVALPAGETPAGRDSGGQPANPDPQVAGPADVAVGGPLRKRLFDQLRPKISAMVGGRAVRFEGELKTYRKWAFFTGRAVDESGDSLKIGELENDDTVGLWIRARDGWKLVDYSGGHSDVFYLTWPGEYGVPKRLLGFE